MLVFGIKEIDKIGKKYAENILETIDLNVIIRIAMSNIDNFANIWGIVLGMIMVVVLFNKKYLIS